MQTVNIDALRRKDDYHQHEGPDWVRNIWKRPESLNWFIKANRTKLINAKAIMRLGRDWFINVDLFPKAAQEILGIKVTEAI